MKKFLLAIILMSLVACGRGPVSTPTETSTLSPVPPTTTLIPPSETPLPTETQIPIPESDLNWEYINSHRLLLPEVVEANGAQMRVKIGFDESIQNLISKVQLHDNWRSDAGLTAEQIPAIYMQHVYYAVWVENQKSKNTGNVTIDFTTYMEWVVQAQKSGAATDWDRVAIDILANDAATPYKLEKMRVAPMFIEGGSLPERVRPLITHDLITVQASHVKNIEILNAPQYEAQVFGMGNTLQSDGTMVTYMSPYTSNPDQFGAVNVVAMMALLDKSLLRGKFTISANSAMGSSYLLEIIAKKRGQYYSSFFQIVTPATSTEKRFNR